MRLVKITSVNSLYPVIACVVFVGSITVFDICVPLFITSRGSPTAKESGDPCPDFSGEPQ